MIYVVFALIVGAALFYLLLSDQRFVYKENTAADNELVRMKERAASIQLSLKDIEYEKSVGKLDDDNAARLTDELLGEWDTLERKISEREKQTPVTEPADSCGTCGAHRLIATAKFCHACGAKLAILIGLAFFFFSMPDKLAAYDIRATIENGTTGKTEMHPLSVQLLKLEQGMQPVTAKTSASGKVEFLHLPEMTSGPYMLQATFRGVTYSKVIPPNLPSPAEVKLEIFDSTASPTAIRVRTLLELRRTAKNSLSGLMILFFVNTDRRAFTGGPEGLRFYLPPVAEIEQASISVGGGNSNIQWLKLNPKSDKNNGYYAIGQNIKPGDRILQVLFKLPYDDKGSAFPFESLYPQDTGIQLLAEPVNLEVKNGGEATTRVRDASLGRDLISFKPTERKLLLAFSGGDVVEAKRAEETEVEIKSPLSLTQKIFLPLVAICVFATGLYLRSRKLRSA